jgi:hypothetical protein
MGVKDLWTKWVGVRVYIDGLKACIYVPALYTTRS